MGKTKSPKVAIKELADQLERSPKAFRHLLGEFAIKRLGLQLVGELDGYLVLGRSDGYKARVIWNGKQFSVEQTDLDKPTFVPGAGVRGNATKAIDQLLKFSTESPSRRERSTNGEVHVGN